MPEDAAALTIRRQYDGVVDRVDSLAGSLTGEEQSHALRVLAVARTLMQRERASTGNLETAEKDLELRRELGRLVEFLGRRSAKAIPCATLGRATIADLSSDRSSFTAACRECDEKLLAFGL